MAVVDSDLPTLADHARRMDPNGSIAKITESLSRRNAFLQDAVFKEGNLPTGHKFTSRTGLPSVAWRKFNEGVKASKSKTDQVTEACGMLEGLSKVDVALANLNGNAPAFRQSEDMGFVQSMNNEAELGFTYRTTKTAPEQINGLIPRLDVTAGNKASSQIIKKDAAAAGADQTSILLVCWGPDSVYGIFPKGSKAGLTPDDMGKQLTRDANGNEFRAWVTNWSWQLGCCVEDYRQLVRICNIDTSLLVSNDLSLIETMIDAFYQIGDPKKGRMTWYANRKIGAFLHKQALNGVKNSTLSIDNIGGQPITSLLGAPIRITDAITNTESPVV